MNILSRKKNIFYGILQDFPRLCAFKLEAPLQIVYGYKKAHNSDDYSYRGIRQARLPMPYNPHDSKSACTFIMTMIYL
jgi:hypothetical protein